MKRNEERDGETAVNARKMREKKNKVREEDGEGMPRRTPTWLRVLLTILAQLVCLFLAVCCWLYVVEERVDQKTIRYTVPVELMGEEALYAETGISIVDQNLYQVEVSYTGTRRELSAIDPAQIRVYADLNVRGEVGWNLLHLVVEDGQDEVAGVPASGSVMVYLDKMTEVELPLTVRLRGQTRTDRQISAQPNVSTLKVRVSRDLVPMLGTVELTVEESGEVLGIRTVELNNFRFLDTHGSDLTLFYVTTEPSAVTVTVTVSEGAAG